MAYTTINKSKEHFDTNLYQANGSGKTISGMDFQPSMVWTKNRDNASYIHAIVDQVRGGTKKLFSNSDVVEATDANAITAWTSDGYTFGSSGSFNYSTENYVNWCWKGNGAGVSNSDGTVTSTVSVNTTAGFSIVKWSAASNITVGHGLGVKPSMIICKSMTEAAPWLVWHKDLTASSENENYLLLSTTAVQASYSNYWGSGGITNQVFGLSSNTLNNNRGDMIAYVFADVPGYQKCGRYYGNGDAQNGAFIYTGFAPSLVVYKNISEADEWFVKDNKRPGHNPTDLMFWSADNAETSLDRMNLYSNGFQATTTDKGANKSGNYYVYLAIGQSLVGSNNVPCTAR